MRRMPDAPDRPVAKVEPAFTFTAPAHRRAQRSDEALGLECLARTLDQASRNMSLVSLNSAEQAAGKSEPREAADATRKLAEQMTSQLRSLELALSEVLPARR